MHTLCLPDLTTLEGLDPTAHKAVVQLGEFARDRVAPTARRRDSAPLGTVDWDLVAEAQALGGLRMGIPETLGGLGLGNLALGHILEEFAAADPGFALILGATGLFHTPLILSGDKRLSETYLVPFTGDTPLLGSNAVAEELNGMDVVRREHAEFATDFTVARDAGDHFVVRGKKKYITNAPVSRFATVMANVEGNPGSTGMTCFVIDLEWDGVGRGETHDKVGYRAAPAGELVFNGVRVPKENVIGDVLGGWDLNITQGNLCRITCAAISTGIARHALQHALQWSTERRQTGKTLYQHQMSARKLADMAARVASARALWTEAARMADVTLPVPELEPALAKLVADEASVFNANAAASLLGAQGFQRNDDMERIVRDSLGPRIYEGSPEALAMTITEQIARG
ncbi:acyl-CoA dehydrogenase family protein [Streptomyces sp. NA04227]|uniref:acyl-CoA dehydrogenase family protein n=1 Tax=Streptomyces sp. NA04227 TaxID=2742136 RepID=UPI0015905BEB|nr:acyl-CoA dehydrogenase family protein [Streptomyces sp. NA04227]QKW09782.1 acyl-CoA dehydrogenase family protein [Streptomyces sp. NA04227]